MAIGRKKRENRLLQDLVSCYSPSGKEQPAAELLLKFFQHQGWKALIDGVGNVIGEIGVGSPVICFLGHIDTVAGEIPPRLERKRLYGRGAVDAKGSLAAATCAAARLPSGLSKKIIIVGAVEEEAPSSRGARHIVGRIRPDFAIIGEPSRWDRLAIGYKGIFHYKYTLRKPRTHGAAESPSATTHTVALFADTIKEAEIPAGWGSPFKALTTNIRSINTVLEEFAEQVTVTVDMRLPPSVDPNDLERKVRQSAGDAIIDVIEKLPAVRCGKNNRLVRTLLDAIRQTGGQPRFVLKSGTSDMNVVAQTWDCPMVAYGPGDSNLDHTPEEHIDLDEYQKAIAILEKTFLNL